MQNSAVAFTEGNRLGRKQLDQTDGFPAGNDWAGENRPNSQGAAAFTIHAFVGFGVVTDQYFRSAYAFAGKTGTGFLRIAPTGGALSPELARQIMVSVSSPTSTR